MSNSTSKNIVIKEARIKWAKVQDPAANYKKNGMEYSLDLEVSESQLAALYKEGMSDWVKPKDDDGIKYITFKKPTLSAKGVELRPLRVLGRNKEPFKDLIGNGSVVNVVLSVYNDGKNGSTSSIRPEVVQVVDLVEYSGGVELDNLLGDLDADLSDDEFSDAELI